MANITLELIASSNSSYQQAQSIVLELVSHVHQRVERFRYLDDIKTVGVALDYLENPELDSWRHLQVANRTYGIAANSDKNAEVRKEWGVTTGVSLSSEYKTLLITDELGTDTFGKSRPLFWRHALPENVVSCQLEIMTRGNLQKVDNGFRVDLASGNIFTNFKNFFDPDTGAYTLFFVTCTQEDGTSTHQLLQPEPVAKLADWQDIDLTTGRLTDSYPVYSQERNASGYTFYMNGGNTWYSKPTEGSLIQPRLPAGREPEDPWYLRFSAGDVSAVANGRVRRYHVPEYDKQNYSPSKPYVYSPYAKMLWVNDTTIASPRQNLAIDPEGGLHITIFISDYENNLLRVLTSDSGLEGTRYSDTDVYYESDQIRSWDNEGGFIVLSTKIHPSYQLSSQHYYEADDYEHTGINLNPLYHDYLVDKMVVFYMVPDADPDDHAIHYLVVDQEGVIRKCSQELGFSHPNLQLLNADGTYNAGSIIGRKYISDIQSSTFLNDYAAGYENDYAYGIIAEVVILNLDDQDDMKVYDVRAKGLTLRPDRLLDVLKANPRILQSSIMYGQDGQEIPKNKVMIIKAPLSLRDDYGGVLPKEKAEELLTRHLDSGALPVIEWTYPAADITCVSQTASQVDLTWSWEGPGLTYKLYKKSNVVGEWLEIYEVAGAATPIALTYTDLDVTTGDVVYYTVRAQEQINSADVLYPRTHSISVKVA